MRSEVDSGLDRAKTLTADLLSKLLPEDRAFAVRLWDGTVLQPRHESPRATLVLTRSEAPGHILQPPLDLALGEAYLRGDIDIEGDFDAVLELIETVGPRLSPLDWAQVASQAAALRRHADLEPIPLAASLRGRRHTAVRDKDAIQYHYDVSNEFYQLWLDQRMVYSCAYFASGDETLDEAQEAKLELICRKLRLKPGDRLLDIGAGWGALVIYAAQKWGAEGLGITLAERQLEEARARIEAAGLADKVGFELQDYRDVSGEYDKVASIGMAEHVGRENHETYFRSAYQSLKPGGLMLNHAISRGPRAPNMSSKVVSGEFTQRYIFPDGEILPLWESLKAAESVGFEVRDVEDLREHYAKTLRHWADNLEANWEAAVDQVGVTLARLRRLMMRTAAFHFDRGHVAVHQALLAKPDRLGRVPLPPSRADVYRTA